ncbi:hypothetical protein PoB_007640400 [Plakobranchus ocellatus]|uniref:Secreted protein n=1 Tax=Plakobranchus ocellatus TaxID=259542 RepID=A0AAV4E082_9GAST|nr:hypothetical protein PoB_007640400 [Plakobranchus ocellatus]
MLVTVVVWFMLLLIWLRLPGSSIRCAKTPPLNESDVRELGAQPAGTSSNSERHSKGFALCGVSEATRAGTPVLEPLRTRAGPS